MAFHSNFFFTLLISSYVISLIDASNNGITVDLIHRDSPLSPFYNPNITRFERLRNAFHRSLARKTSLNPTSISTTDSFQELLKYSVGEYLMKISIGTPPVQIIVIADTGSDLLWTKCLPCKKCKQNAPLFDPRKSTSYRNLSCGSNLCHALGNDGYCENNYCQYSMPYRDNSYSNGDLAEETISLQSNSGKPVPFKVAFGCGHDNHENSEEIGAAGIIGLGGGDLSLVNQLYKSIGGKFSYCLTQINESHSPSKISFGSNASFLGPKVVSTPLIKKRSDDTSYYLNLEGITVGTNRLNYETTSINNQGNIMIDSGTTLTYFPEQFYQKLESELLKVIKGKPVTDPKGGFESKLCYLANREDFDAPKIVVHFTDADLELSSTSTFFEGENGTLCLTMVPSEQSFYKDSACIFGNLNQMNQLVGYDLVNNKVSFMPTDCSKYP